MKALTVAALAALLCALGAGSSAVAANAPPLGLTAFGSIVVDDAHGHVFVSGPNENEVLVFNFGGELVATVPNISGAAAMVVQGSSLYVVAGKSGSIERIDLATLSDTGSVATGLGTPRWLAFAGGKLWTGVNGNGQWTQLASVALNGTVTVFTPTYYNPDFATTPADPNALYLAQDGLSPGSLYRLDVSGGSPVVSASNVNTNGSNIQQLAVSPDGTRVIPASGAPYAFQEFAASTLTADGIVYPAQPYPSAVAVSPGSGGLLATGLANGYSAPDISVFRLGNPQAIFTATTTNSSGTANVVPHGLALTPDGSRLFAVTADNVYSNAFHLWLYNLSATATTTSVTVTPSPSSIGQAVTARATVMPTDGGGTVSFTANDSPIPGCPEQQLTKAPNGFTATCTTTALPGGQVVVTAKYSGDTQYLGSSGSTTTTVNRATTATSVAVAPSPSAFGQEVRATATVTPGDGGGTVSFSANNTPIPGCSAQALSGSVATCTTTALPVGQVVVTASYSGDTQYLGSTGSTTTTVNRAATSLTASPAQLVRSKSGTYTTTLRATLTANGAPVAGRAVVFASAGAQLCTATTNTSGSASCGITVSNSASRTLTKNGYSASFNGDAQYLASSAGATVSG